MRKYDIDLDRRDIQQLSTVDEIAAFFAKLGYSTDARIEQTARNLGITAEGAKRPIKDIWLIADEDTFLQVYLFELKSVTMTNIRELARTFRNKAGNYLFILTSDYNRLDFVLIARIAPTATSDRIGTKQSGVRPRVLTVDRTNPGPVAIRVLRRFTFTESDPIYQYQKLLSAYSIADWSEEYFNNRALFSDYFLMNRLRARPEWSEDPKPAYKCLKEIYKESLSEYLSEREVETRSKLYEPTFKALGFKYITGKTATDPSPERPDYYLYSLGQKKEHEKPLAVALVYPWGRSLDGKDDRRDKDTPDENPGAAVVSLLEADQAPWAIVTNGQTWRLYSQKTHSRATNYYEIDLTEALSLGSPAHTDPAQAFRYYWLFFSRKAFEKKGVIHEGKEVEQSFLDQLLVGSEEYAKELGERLKERIFERIFPHLAGGFIANIRANEGKDASLPQERLDHIFQGTLTLLYRLLFLLYAESRDLLPAKEVRGYYEASIKKLKEEIAEIAGTIEDEAPAKTSRHYRADEFEIYERLSRLFKVIDKGDEKLNVPVYNGGLFVTDADDDDQSSEAINSRFLRDYAVPDRYIAQSIDLVARDVDDKRQDLVFIDYKSLGVRQLGSMYEGLLEFRLRIAPTKMAIVKGKKTEEIIPHKEAVSKKRKILTEGRGRNARKRTISKGTVYLENDKRERKATGSYYTPGHIVKYIVEHAVGPVLKDKLEALRPKLRDVEQKRKAFEDRQRALQQRGLKAEPEEKKKLIGRDLVADVFNIRVLDPAMGSGHFLVQAVDLITDKMLHFLNSFPVNPVRDFLEKTRETILNEMEVQGITIDGMRLTDVNLLKRHVLKRCIYGVDLNPMAVELAKVSLWLDCFTLGAPLSFLDHHLRCGNSLIGATVQEVRETIEKGQYGLFALVGSRFTGLMLATDLMREVAELPDVTSKDVSESRRRYKKATDALAPFKRLLGVYTSRWFGNVPYTSGKGRNKTQHDPAKEFLLSQEAEAWLKDPEDVKLSNWAHEIAEKAASAVEEKRFFHWELEFPEIFYGPRPGTERVIERLEGAGFDAVVGNPPYVRQEGLGDWKLAFQNMYNSVFNGVADIYVFFIKRGVGLLSDSGIFCYIVSNKWMRAKYGSQLRQWLKSQNVLEVIDFRDLPVFRDATSYPCLLRIRNGKPQQVFFGVNVDTLDYQDLGKYVASNKFSVSKLGLRYESWSLSDEVTERLLGKIFGAGIPLSKYVRNKIYRGVTTGFNKAFIIDKETRDYLISQDVRSAELIKPQLVGRNIKRYRPLKYDRYLIFTQRGVRIDDYPAIKDYLFQFKNQLMPKPKRWKEDNWPGRKPGDYKWYEIQDTTAYACEFEKEKIVFTEIATKGQFCLDVNNCFCDATAYIISSNSRYLLGILNSSLTNFLFSETSSEIRGGFLRWKRQYVSPLPIRVIDANNKADRTNHEELAELVERIEACYQRLENDIIDERKEVESQIEDIDRRIDLLVYKLYGLSDREIALVEDSGK